MGFVVVGDDGDVREGEGGVEERGCEERGW